MVSTYDNICMSCSRLELTLIISLYCMNMMKNKGKKHLKIVKNLNIVDFYGNGNFFIWAYIKLFIVMTSIA